MLVLGWVTASKQIPAWNTVVDERPGLELYDADDAHPSYLGSYLGAAVYFSTIFQESASVNSYSGGVDADVAAYLRTVASETVLDSPSLWRLRTLDGPCARL